MKAEWRREGTGRDAPIASSEFPRAIVRGVCAQQARRHTWPGCKDDECKQVAKRHCPSSRLVQSWACRTALHFPNRLVRLVLIGAVSRVCVVEEPNQEGDRTRDMYEGVCPVDPSHDKLVLHEELLYGQLPEYVYPLLYGNDL